MLPDPLPPELPEDLKLAIRLETIFMPYSRRKRDALWPNGKRFAHYTSAEAALGIIESKRLWMRNATCMSDYREIQHGFDILRNFFSQQDKTNAFHAALDACCCGVGQEAIQIFDHWWSDTRLETYVASISEHDDSEDLHGRLSMWRAFGGSSARVAIVLRLPFNADAANTLNVMFGPVAYMAEPEVHKEIETAIQNINCIS